MKRLAALAVTVAGGLLLATGAAGADAAPPAAWQPTGLAGGGAMFAISASPHDPNLLLLSCDMSGAYLSRDGGRHWQLLDFRQLAGNIGCPALFHPTQPDVIYAPHGPGGELRVSTDRGKTWREFVAHGPWRGPLRGLYLPDGRTFFVATDQGLWRSADDGRTWQASAGVTGAWLGLCADRRVAGRLLAGTRAGVFRSDDQGVSFRPVGQGLPKLSVQSFAGGSDGQRTMLYVALECRLEAGKLAGGLYASADAGDTWARVMNPELNRETRRSSQWANGDLPQYRFVLTTDRQPQRVYAYCAGTSYYPPNHSTVYRSDDAGQSWKAVFFSDPRFTGVYNVEDDRLTLGLGQRWQEVPHSMGINPANPDQVLLTTSMFVFGTRDGGRSWQVAQDPQPQTFGKLRAWPCNGLVVTSAWNFYRDPFDRQRQYICYTDIGFARSRDAGRTWIWDGPRLPWPNTTFELAFDPAVKGQVWGAFSNTHDIPNYNIIGSSHRVIMEGGVAVSTDHGETWQRLGLPAAPCVSVVLDPQSPRTGRTLYAALFERGVYKSTDGGSHWEPRNTGLGTDQNRRCCRLLLHRDGTLFNLITAKKLAAGTYDAAGAGLYRSTDGAATWTKITAALPCHWPKDFTVKPDDSRTILLGAANIRGHAEAGLYRTTDGGGTWTKLVTKGSEHFGAAYHPQRPGWIYLTLCEGATEAALYLSRDDGQTWEPFLDLPFQNVQRVHFDPADDNHIWVTTFGASVWHGPATPGGR